LSPDGDPDADRKQHASYPQPEDERAHVVAVTRRPATSVGRAESLLSHAAAMGRDAETEAKIAELNAQLDQLAGAGSVRN